VLGRRQFIQKTLNCLKISMMEDKLYTSPVFEDEEDTETDMPEKDEESEEEDLDEDLE